MTLIYAIGVAIAAQTFIYSGLIFMAGRLFPSLLAPLYDLVPNATYRVVFSTFTVMLVGNYLFQRLYSQQPILNAGVISTVTGILIVNTGGLIIEQKSPNILMAIGVIVLVTGAVLCIYARSRL
jgi:hypothetical protein